MTATELYSAYPEFKLLIDSWVSDRTVPFGLGDWLQENGEEALATVARKAAEIVEGRYDYIGNFPKDGGRDIACGDFQSGLYPADTLRENKRYIWFSSDIFSNTYCCDLPTTFVDITESKDKGFDSPLLAILAYLDLAQNLEQKCS